MEERAFEGEKWAVPSKVRKIIPPKIGLLFWQVCHNKIACKNNLLRRGVSLEDNGVCSLCNLEPETTEHLFVHCRVIWGLWTDIISREGVHWVAPKSLADLAEEWEYLGAVSDPILWNLIPYSMIWSIWMGRNDLVFREKDFNKTEI